MDKEDQIKFSGIEDPERLESDLKWAHRKVHIDEPNWRLWYIVKDNKVMGNLGFHNISTKDRRAEIGYAMHPEFRKQGFMFEAIQTLINYALTEKLFRRIEAFIAPDNTRSINLISKFGFEKEAILRSHHFFQGKINDSVVYAILQD